MQETIIFDIDQLDEVVQKINEKLKDCKIITFTGPLGAGKTTIIKKLLEKWGVCEPVVSPTFNYMNIYKNSSGKAFVHFDLYRVKSVEDFLMAGFDEYLHWPDTVCLIEWPQVIGPLLQNISSKVCRITIDYQGGYQRIVKILI